MSTFSVSPGDAGAIVLPAAVLESLGLKAGDAVEVTVNDRQLILRPVEDTERRQRLEAITQEVLERRRDAYQRLA
jgi:AbrB family looped-hinge helix DNA binding protein